MEKNNLPPFYIGQEIEAVITHRDGVYSRGEKFKALSTKQCACGCGTWVVDIGRYTKHIWMVCRKTAKDIPNDNYYLCNSFKPVQTINLPLMTFAKIKEAEKEEILVLN